MFVYHFVDPDLRINIFFEKEVTAENGELISCAALHTCIRGVKKISCRAYLLFCWNFGDKKNSFLKLS